MLKKVLLVLLMMFILGFTVGTASAVIEGGLVEGLVSQAYVNPANLGDSLIYGYYNVRNNLNLFNIINTSATAGAVVRVVFRNGVDSKECLDFTICLSAGDVWTGYLADDGTTARLYSFDSDTYTAPTIPAVGQPFKYAGAGGISGVTADDCREGYFEVVGLMGVAGYDKTNRGGKSAIIGSEAECRDFSTDDNDAEDVNNALFGNNTIFDLTALGTYSYNATAIADTTLFATDKPAGQEASITNIADHGISEINFILTKGSVISPYDIMSDLAGKTELIVTFPTKLASNPFLFDWKDKNGNKKVDRGEQCATTGAHIWDTAEHQLDVTDFSPSPGSCIPYEVNVIRIGGNNGTIWDSPLVSQLSTGSFDLGWINLVFDTDSDHYTSYFGWEASGLPLVAYTTQSFLDEISTYMTETASKTSITID